MRIGPFYDGAQPYGGVVFQGIGGIAQRGLPTDGAILATSLIVIDEIARAIGHTWVSVTGVLSPGSIGVAAFGRLVLSVE